jgi:hypothetical protein
MNPGSCTWLSSTFRWQARSRAWARPWRLPAPSRFHLYTAAPSSPRLAPSINPWTGMVQAWLMPFRVPGARVLGPRPGPPPQQAYFAGAPSFPSPGVPQPPPPSTDVWNNQALLTALATSGVPPTGPQATELFLDTGATSHMASNAGNFTSSQPLSNSPSITLGNGALLPVTHRASSSLPTVQSPLLLNNILVSPS